MLQPVQPLRLHQRVQPLPHVLYAYCLLPFVIFSLRSMAGSSTIGRIAACARAMWFNSHWLAPGHPLTLPPDDNNAGARPVVRSIEPGRRGGCWYPAGTAGHCPSLGDSARHGNARRIRSGLAATSARMRFSGWTGPSAKVIKRILSSPNVPPAVRRKVEEYIEARIGGLYRRRGHSVTNFMPPL